MRASTSNASAFSRAGVRRWTANAADQNSSELKRLFPDFVPGGALSRLPVTSAMRPGRTGALRGLRRLPLLGESWRDLDDRDVDGVARVEMHLELRFRQVLPALGLSEQVPALQRPVGSL